MSDAMKVIYICFPEGKHKVLTMSYDDGKLADRRLVSIFNHYGIKGTFHLNSGMHGPERIPSEEWKALYEGHEMSCHTVTHRRLQEARLNRWQYRCLRTADISSVSQDIRCGDFLIQTVLIIGKSSSFCQSLVSSTAALLEIRMIFPCRKITLHGKQPAITTIT